MSPSMRKRIFCAEDAFIAKIDGSKQPTAASEAKALKDAVDAEFAAIFARR